MDFRVTVNAGPILNAEWPASLPPPVIDDEVLWQLGQDSLLFIVKSRSWGIGIDPRTGKPLTVLRITGESL